MTITVFGASGQTGMEVVRQALELGFNVKAFVRVLSKLNLINEKLNVIEGDVLQPETIVPAVKGSDAIVIVLGSKPDTKFDVLTRGTQNIINIMKNSDVKRIIVQSSFPMSGNAESMEFLKTIMSEEQIKGMQPLLDDKIGQEKAVVGSNLDWTIIKPMFLTNDPKTGKIQAAEKLTVTPESKISRADVAEFILNELKNPQWVRKTVVITQ